MCGTDLPAQRGPRARRYCSRACQQQAYRARQARHAAHRLPPGGEQLLIAEYDGVPARQLADHLSLAAGRIAGALSAGQPADGHDLDVLARVPVVLAARAHRACVDHAPAAATPRTPTVTAPGLDAPDRPDRAAPAGARPPRDGSVPSAAAGPEPAARTRPATKTSRDDSRVQAVASAGIEPRPQRLARKRALAIAEAAELVRSPEHQETRQWVLRSGDTVLGMVEPTYGGVSRSGRNGWTSRLAGATGQRRPTRQDAATDLADRWLRLVTATPKRTITGNN